MSTDELRAQYEAQDPSHVDILIQQARHEEKIDMILDKLDEAVDTAISHRERTNERLSNLENWRSRLVGAYIALGGIVTLVGSYLGFTKT